MSHIKSKIFLHRPSEISDSLYEFWTHVCELLLHASGQSSFDYVRSMVRSLLVLGATAAAATHFLQYIYENHSDAVFISTSHYDDVEAVGALVLRPDTRDLIVTSPELLSFWLGMFLEMSTPVILQSRWTTDIIRMNENRLKVLETLVELCGLYTCSMTDPVSDVGVRGLFLLAYQGQVLTSISKDYRSQSLEAIPTLYSLIIRSSFPQWPWNSQLILHANGSSKVKVGFVSAFFSRHSVGRLLVNVILGLNEKGLVNADMEVVIVNLRSHDKQDDITKALRGAIPSQRYINLDTSRADISEAVKMIRSHEFDVLVFGDLFMDSFTAHLGMFRLAKTCVLFWGHPFSSGYESFDYFITSSSFEFDGSTRFR